MEQKKRFQGNWIIITAILIIAAVITVLNVRMIFTVTSKQTDELGTLQMNDIRAQLQATLDKATQDTLLVASDVDMILAKDGNERNLEKYLSAKKQELGDGSFINVYAAGPDWHVIPGFDEPEGFDPLSREWYIGAYKQKGDIYISQPYMDLVTGQVCFTVSRLLSDGRVVVSLDYNLLTVQDYIKTMSKGGNVALIVTEDGRIAGYNDTTKLGLQLADVLPDYVDILELEKNNKNQVVLPKVIDGVKQTVFCSKTENNWYLILCVNTAELYKKSYTQLAWLTLINVLLILAIVGLYFWAVNNGRKAEKALHVREEFLEGISMELRSPLTMILNNSNPNIDVSPQDGMERIREAALHLSDMVNNLLSYSNIVTSGEDEKRTKYSSTYFYGANKKVRATIIFIILVAMVISVSVFSASSINLGNQQMRSDAQSYEYELSQWIIEQKSILSMFCNMITANPEILEDYEQCIHFLDDITRNYEDISVVYMTNPEAEHTVMMNNGWQPDEGWFVEERQWYIDTISSPTGFNISSPYFDEQTGLYCVTFSQRVYDKNGHFLGNFGIDFYMDKLIEILGESYTDNGYAFLVDADGYIINHPYAYYQMTQASSSNVIDKAYVNAYANIGTITTFRDYDNALKTCIAKQNVDSNFTIVVVKSWWSIYGNIVLFCSVILLMFVFCVYAVYYLISRLMQWQLSVNDELQKAVETATAAGKAKSQFLAQMSHEIRTPINAVLGMNEMILRESTNADILGYAADIQSAGRTLLSLINSILDFSKIEDGKMEIVDVEYETVPMINDLVNMISERAAKKGLKFKLEVDPMLPRVMVGDDMRLRQIVTNLLTNSVKYTEQGSITLVISGSRIDDDHIELLVSVSDTGIGIREEDKEKLGQSFQRLDQEKNHNIEGTGLGLSIVSRMLAMMNSELKVDSIYGEGSNFYFTVEQEVVDRTPIGDYSHQHSDAPLNNSGSDYLYAPTARLLIVDDNEMNIKVISSLLKRNGIVPTTAKSGIECINILKKESFDVVFLDHMMPVMDGIQTLHQLKDEKIVDEKSIIIALTANAISGARDMYIEEGFTDYLSKPVDVAALEQKLMKYLPEEKLSSAGSLNSDVETKQDTNAATVENETTEELVDVQSGLHYCAGDIGIYREVIKTFIEESEEYLVMLDELRDKKDWPEYAVIAHAVKSTSLTLGANVLSAIAKEHEFAAKEERVADIESSFAQFIDLYKAVMIRLSQI